MSVCTRWCCSPISAGPCHTLPLKGKMVCVCRPWSPASLASDRPSAHLPHIHLPLPQERHRFCPVRARGAFPRHDIHPQPDVNCSFAFQIRGFLSRFDNVLPVSLAFDKCTACSSKVSHPTSQGPMALAPTATLSPEPKNQARPLCGADMGPPTWKLCPPLFVLLLPRKQSETG